ncbi:SMI1/KNR4 family protein [Pseudozobellia sp. WGM2]|uniref:SMI1/KNR4 family protein n=1 Tax=Pseudozobellia sp. WGM2 TaxID=2787625 RepID=UPI001ADF3020|nr:SMI1/KNR4 family protein [Pseudozobellia sp. WGM2]
MDIKSIPYNNQLKKLQLTDIPFNTVVLTEIPEPFYTDYSHHKNEIARNHKSFDTQEFKSLLLEQLSEKLGENVVRLLFITPKETGLPYDAFAYLSNKEIVALHIDKNLNLDQWMSIVLERQYKNLERDKLKGLFESQPELNPNPQFMLTLGKGEFSKKMVNSGMLVDERPYENTGAYLHKRAPEQYNEAKIAKEKQHYIKKYIDTSGASINSDQLSQLFNEFLTTKSLSPNPAQNNESVYSEFESLANYKYPEELKVLLNHHNGIENTGFLSAEQILAEWKNWKTIFDDPNWRLADLTGNNHPDGRKTIGMYTNPYWVPFLSTSGGNFIAIDYAPGSKGTSGQIIAFGADEIKIRFIAENMEDFLRQFINGDKVLNNGF